MRCSSRLDACRTGLAKGCSGRETTRPHCVHHPAPDDCLSSLRTLSHFSASVSGRAFGAPSHRRRRPLQIVAGSIFDPPPFNPAQLTVEFTSGACTSQPCPPAPRRYTLTHNDITGALSLTIGQDYNTEQISGFYTRLLRDEVMAEWHHDDGYPSLHLYCHVSGEERWLAPPQLRDYIFRRELPLVLDTFLHADRQYFQENSKLKHAFVYVHFHSHVPELNQLECWGMLGDRSTWQKTPTSILQRAWLSVIGLAQLAPRQPDESPAAQAQRAAEMQALSMRGPQTTTGSGAAAAPAAPTPSDNPTASSVAGWGTLPQGQAAGAGGSNGVGLAAGAAAAAAMPTVVAAAAGSAQEREAARQPDAGSGGGAGYFAGGAVGPNAADGRAVQQPGAGGSGVAVYASAGLTVAATAEGPVAVFADDPELLLAAAPERDLSAGSNGSSGSAAGAVDAPSGNGHASGNGSGAGGVPAAAGARAQSEAGVGVVAALPDRAAATMLGISPLGRLEGGGSAWRCLHVPVELPAVLPGGQPPVAGGQFPRSR